MASHDESSDTRRLADEAPWAEAYDALLSRPAVTGEGSNLLPLIYALRDNDARLARALLGFARERALDVGEADAALAVLEVAEAALSGRVQKDVCARIAGNLLDEAYEQLLDDRRFDRYFTARCASSAARLATHVREPSSLQDATEVIRAAASLARISGAPSDGTASASRTVERAHACIRAAIRPGKGPRPRA